MVWWNRASNLQVLNSDALKAINVLRSGCGGPVSLEIEKHVTRNPGKPLRALQDFLAEARTTYIGTAFELKEQLMALFRAVGIADTVDQLQLLIATFSHHKALANSQVRRLKPYCRVSDLTQK